MAKPVLYLMLGYPGAGKTTAAELIGQLTGAVHVWADQRRHELFQPVRHSQDESLKLYEILNTEVEGLLTEGKSVIFDTNFNYYRDRQHLRQLAAGCGAEVRLVWVQAPLELARERATKLPIKHDHRIWGNMPVDDFERLAGQLEPPHADEPFVTLDGQHITAADVKKALKL